MLQTRNDLQSIFSIINEEFYRGTEYLISSNIMHN